MKSKHDDMSAKHWETRPEKKWKDFKFSQPYEKGTSRLKEEVLGKTNFDPTVLFQWGTMQAMAVLEILKAVEAEFDEKGQKVVFDAMRRVGMDVGRQILRDAVLPDNLAEAEFHSFYATVINRIAYASLETAEVVSEDIARFHIDWCPHQDHYGPMDCRVQRYFVQGMIEAGREFAEKHGHERVFDVAFRTTIPSGAETCLFEIRCDTGHGEQWAEYTHKMEEKALEIARSKYNRKG